VQYGPRLAAACAYLWHGQFLSRGRTCEALRDLFGVPVSPGAVAGMVNRIAGKLAWVHSASSGKFALVTVHGERGRAGMDAAGVLPAFRGIAVHDCWAPYDGYDQVTHALCNAHALRELQAVIDAAPPGQWCWAAQAADAQRDMKHLADASLVADGTLNHLDQAKLAEVRHRYHSALLIGQRETAPRAGPLMRKHHALARRLLARDGDYLRYTTDPRVPFDNTQPNARSGWASCGSRSPGACGRWLEPRHWIPETA
jgi:transposase